MRRDTDSTKFRKLSQIGFRGSRIPIHRSIRSITFPRSRFLVILLLPLLFNIIFWLTLNPLLAAWQAFFEFWVAKLNLEGSVGVRVHELAGISLSLPDLQLAARAADSFMWWAMLASDLLALALSFTLRGTLLPLSYLIRFLVLIQVTALIFFAIWPDGFPYDVANYTGGALTTALVLMVIIPWVHALTYYIFNFSLPQKFALTTLTLAFIAIATPFQYALHAYIICKFSLLVLPGLYFIFGILLDVLVFVALYGWAMSWPRSEDDYIAG